MSAKPWLQPNGDVAFTPPKFQATIIWLHGGGDTAENAFQLFCKCPTLVVALIRRRTLKS